MSNNLAKVEKRQICFKWRWFVLDQPHFLDGLIAIERRSDVTQNL